MKEIKKNKLYSEDWIFIIFFIIVGVIIIFKILSIYGELCYYENYCFGRSLTFVGETLDNKRNLLEDSAILNSELQKIYKFNITNYNKMLTEEQLKEFGGSCGHYAKWYFDKLKSLGYETKLFHINENSMYSGHIFTVAWNYDRSVYCIYEQIEYKCFLLKPIKIRELETIK